MTELEQYLFDLQGFIVVEDALTNAEIATLNGIIDQQIVLFDEPGKLWFRFNHVLGWGTPFQSLIDNSRITAYLLDLLGSKFRLDHDYIHIIRQGPGPIGCYLHGGGTPYDPCQYYLYKNGRITMA